MDPVEEERQARRAEGEHNDMLCSKMFLLLLFGIEEEVEEEEDSI